MKRHYTRWTPKMEQELQASWRGRTSHELAKLLNEHHGTAMTRWAVNGKLRQLGVRRAPRWTPGERAVVRTELSLAINRLRTRLQRRVPGAIVHEMMNVLMRQWKRQRVDRIA